MGREVLEETLNAPIPGESLTNEMGAVPWQRPPRFSSVEETVQHYSRVLSAPETSSELVSLLKSGSTVKEISNILVNTSVMEGVHSLDVSVLVAAVVYEMISYLGDEAGISYSTGLEDSSITSNASNQIMADKIIGEFMAEVKDNEISKPSQIMPEPIENIEEVPPAGLMARPIKETPIINEGGM